MLVTFHSTETAEIIMYADVARTLLQAVGKETTARGVFTPEEMQPAAERLRAAVARAEAGATAEAGEDALSWEEQGQRDKEKPVALRRRAWPLLDMLERTARKGAKAHITWEAASDF